jgi:uncharacterized protein (DUF1501 family)
MKRREFLEKTTTAIAMLTPPFIAGLPSATLAAKGEWARTLILVELKGGNDGLNTIVPYADPNYRKFRPNLALGRDKVITLNERLGFHPILEPLLPLWNDHQMAVALGVGYPDPNLSHFRSIDIWDTGSDSDVVMNDGWISQLFTESSPPAHYAADAIVLGRYRPGPIIGDNARIISLANEPNKNLKKASKIDTASNLRANPALLHLLKKRLDLREAAEAIIAKRIENVVMSTVFPDTNLGAQFAVAARLLSAGVEIPVIKLSINGFDTHVKQEQLHSELLGEVAGAVTTFATEMKAQGLWEKVLIMTYSEFGRRPAENNSIGTDHGTSAPHFFLGGKVKGGFYGQQPKLVDLQNGNMKHTLHYRSLYATLAREWWGLDAYNIKEKSLNLIS